MFKKILIGLLLVGVVGVLVYGAVNRTVVKAYNAETTNGNGNGKTAVALQDSDSQRQGRNRQTDTASMLDTTEEFSAERQGRNRDSVDQVAYEQGSQERGGSRRGGNTQSAAQVNGTHGQGGQGESLETQAAAVQDWLVWNGVVTQVDEEQVLLLTAENQEIALAGRALRYAQTLGFTVQVGDLLQVKGFIEETETQIAEITQLATGQVYALRTETGRPLWAGNGGWRGGQG